MTVVLRGHLTRRLDLCSPDELRVLSIVVERLERRRARHGSLDLARRPDVYAELNEGLIDAVIACTILTIRAEDERHDEERRKALLASAADDERAELARWQADDQRTRVSDVSQVIAATPEAVPEPVVEWEAGEGPHARRGKR
ncbi:MAG: hypothetical protein ACM358_04995 [Gemmatimonadota bacterium]